MRIDFSKSELFPQDYTATGGAVILYRRLPNGTCYHAETASPVVGVLERQRTQGGIVRIFYGDIQLKMNAEHHVAFLMGAIFTPVSEFDLA